MDYYNSASMYELQKVAEIYLSEPDWSFDLLGVWRDDKGYYLGTDSGCSCPTPWENHTRDDLTGPLTASQVREEATSLWKLGGEYEPYSFEDALNKVL